MMEQQYDTDLYTRISILENDVSRHDIEIKNIEKNEVDLKIFASLCSKCFPELKKDVSTIKSDISQLKEYKVWCNGIEEGNANFWNRWEWLIKYITFGLIVATCSFIAFTMSHSLGLSV